MIDFASITQTLDGYRCHYWGQREVLISGRTWRVHCFSVWHPEWGSHEKWYDGAGHRLTVQGGQVVKSPIKQYRIVEANNGN